MRFQLRYESYRQFILIIKLTKVFHFKKFYRDLYHKKKTKQNNVYAFKNSYQLRLFFFLHIKLRKEILNIKGNFKRIMNTFILKIWKNETKN